MSKTSSYQSSILPQYSEKTIEIIIPVRVFGKKIENCSEIDISQITFKNDKNLPLKYNQSIKKNFTIQVIETCNNIISKKHFCIRLAIGNISTACSRYSIMHSHYIHKSGLKKKRTRSHSTNIFNFNIDTSLLHTYTSMGQMQCVVVELFPQRVTMSQLQSSHFEK